MSDQSTPKMRVSKLVTLSASYSDEHSSLQPVFTYSGSSRSMQTEVEVKFPAHKENMMFYEHFIRENDQFPYMLSFMCLGEDENGKIISDFGEYKHVEVAEFSREIKSVNLIMQVVSRLPKCREVKIFFDDDNLLSAEDSRVGNNEFIITSQSVKALKIVRLNGVKDPNLDISNTKVLVVLKNAFWHWPGMKYLYIDGMEGGGKTYDFVRNFCEFKQLPKHNLKLRHGQVYCKPQLVMPSTTHNSIVIKEEPTEHSTVGASRNDIELSSLPLPLDLSPYVDTDVIPPERIKTESPEYLLEQRPLAAICAPPTNNTPISTNALIHRPSTSLASLCSLYKDDWGNSSDEETEESSNLYSTSPPVPSISEQSNDAAPRVPPDNIEAAFLPTDLQTSAIELQKMLDAVAAVAGLPSSEETSRMRAVENDAYNSSAYQSVDVEGIQFYRRSSRTDEKRMPK